MGKLKRWVATSNIGWLFDFIITFNFKVFFLIFKIEEPFNQSFDFKKLILKNYNKIIFGFGFLENNLRTFLSFKWFNVGFFNHFFGFL